MQTISGGSGQQLDIVEICLTQPDPERPADWVISGQSILRVARRRTDSELGGHGTTGEAAQGADIGNETV